MEKKGRTFTRREILLGIGSAVTGAVVKPVYDKVAPKAGTNEISKIGALLELLGGDENEMYRLAREFADSREEGNPGLSLGRVDENSISLIDPFGYTRLFIPMNLGSTCKIVFYDAPNEDYFERKLDDLCGLEISTKNLKSVKLKGDCEHISWEILGIFNPNTGRVESFPSPQMMSEKTLNDYSYTTKYRLRVGEDQSILIPGLEPEVNELRVIRIATKPKNGKGYNYPCGGWEFELTTKDPTEKE